MADLKLLEKTGNDARHPAAGRERRIGDDTHQANMATTIDQIHSGLAEGGAEKGCGLLVNFRDIRR